MLTKPIRHLDGTNDIALGGNVTFSSPMKQKNQYRGNMAESSIPALLSVETFTTIVANAPLISIDLIVQDVQGSVLLGLRNNSPAKGYWFAPGGRIRKNETLGNAFSRITQDELGWRADLSQSRFIGIHEHFYDTDFTGAEGATTHYVVLAYHFQVERAALQLPDQQHSQYIWLHPSQIVQQSHVHPYTQVYFKSIQ
jgi:colanic acid biosynthesis protein WcaH